MRARNTSNSRRSHIFPSFLPVRVVVSQGDFLNERIEKVYKPRQVSAKLDRQKVTLALEFHSMSTPRTVLQILSESGDSAFLEWLDEDTCAEWVKGTVTPRFRTDASWLWKSSSPSIPEIQFT